MHGRAKLVLVGASALIAGCGGGGGDKPEHALPDAPAKIVLRSSDFKPGGAFPARLSCGKEVPSLSYRRAPSGTRELALVMRDLDAPGGEFRHWSTWRIPPQPGGRLPDTGLVSGKNSFGEDGYGAPCPPKGDDPHTYVFTLYALGRPVDAEQGASPDAVDQALGAAEPLARGDLKTTFGR
jgi:Raf kinase inhibitor-like YbhB/YbcL family protein